MSHNGEAKEYVVVNVPERGGLREAIEQAGLAPDKIENLKLSGFLNQDDFWYLRNNLTYLKALNLREARVSDRGVGLDDGYNYRDDALPGDALRDMTELRTIVLPERLKAIGDYAFGNTALSGTLNLPEGLEYIGGGAVGQYYGEAGRKTLTGTLRLPSTLKFIGHDAFACLHFSGELLIPESVEYIGGSAFSKCELLTGELHIPESVKYIGEYAFSGLRGMTGTLVYPRDMKRVYDIASNSMFTSVVLPEGPEEISYRAIWTLPVQGDLVVPSTVRKIDSEAFARTKISHVTLPPNIDMIPDRLFDNCKFLQDTVVIPSRTEIIGEAAFARCEKLNAVVIPKNVHTIKRWAFDGCSSLSYIRCDATEPPELDPSSFNGVNKDNFTLEVPEKSVDSYRNAPGWREFRRISAYRNFVARPSKYNVLNKGGVREFILNADADWELTEIPDWCHIDKTSGQMKTVIRLTVDQMPHNSPDRKGKITFRLKGSNEHLTHINVGQYDYEYDEDAVLTINKATKGNGVNLFFVGDGYDAIDISDGKLLADMKEEIEYFFGVEPYKTYRDYFNVFVGIALSEDSGVEDVNHWRNTKFHTVVSNSDTRLEADWEKAVAYSAQVSPFLASASNSGVVLVANTPIYEGVTYWTENNFCAVVTRSEADYPNDARGLVQHEAGGHGIGWLGDEYIYHPQFIQNCPCLCCQHVNDLKSLQTQGYALNLSLTGKYRQVSWSHLIFNATYDDIVDIYEGGFFHGRGVYRSEANSCMNNNVPYHSTWSRQLIVQRIMKLAGVSFSLENFYMLDKRDMGAAYSGTTRSGAVSSTSLHGRPPVHVTKVKFDKIKRSAKKNKR